MTETEEKALAYLPACLSAAVRDKNLPFTEIRLREGRQIYVTSDGKNVPCGRKVTRGDIAHALSAFTKGSPYSYAEEIKSGVITTDEGIRVGLCGRAVVDGGRIDSVRNITSLNIRVPHRVPHAADGLYSAVLRFGSVLVFSPPGGGKTTSLRELIPLLSSGDGRKKVAVIDTRRELSSFSSDCDCADFFEGYPRVDGIITAVTALSPEYLICDEISTAEDADAIIYAASCGVKALCSVHAGSREGLKTNRAAHILTGSGVFGAVYEINRMGGECHPLGDCD